MPDEGETGERTHRNNRFPVPFPDIGKLQAASMRAKSASVLFEVVLRSVRQSLDRCPILWYHIYNRTKIPDVTEKERTWKTDRMKNRK